MIDRVINDRTVIVEQDEAAADCNYRQYPIEKKKVLYAGMLNGYYTG